MPECALSQPLAQLLQKWDPRDIFTHPLTSDLQNFQTDRLNLSIGLAKFKVSQGDYARAKEIADLFGFPYETIGLREDGKFPMMSATA